MKGDVLLSLLHKLGTPKYKVEKGINLYSLQQSGQPSSYFRNIIN